MSPCHRARHTRDTTPDPIDSHAGVPYMCKWEGDKLWLYPGASANATAFTLCRYMEGAKMVTELTYPQRGQVAGRRCRHEPRALFEGVAFGE